MEILVEKREELLTAGYVVFEKRARESGKVRTIYAKPKQCKNAVGVSDHRGIDRNGKILSGGLNDRFSGY